LAHCILIINDLLTIGMKEAMIIFRDCKNSYRG
jgi:hypothetical protein